MAARDRESAGGVPQSVRQLGRLWWLYAGMDLLWIARGTRDALLWICSDVLVSVATVATTLLLAERFGGIGAWSQAQVVFMLAYAMVVNALLDVFFGYNIRMISRRIGRGQLDHMLLQPQPLWRLPRGSCRSRSRWSSSSPAASWCGPGTSSRSR